MQHTVSHGIVCGNDEAIVAPRHTEQILSCEQLSSVFIQPEQPIIIPLGNGESDRGAGTVAICIVARSVWVQSSHCGDFLPSQRG